MIQRNVQELNSFIRIDKLSDLTNKNFNLEVGNDIFVMENLTFYKIKAVGTEPIGEGEIALNSELKIKKIITVGDSSDLKTKLDALSSEIETKLSRKENVIDKKSGFNLEKTNDFLNDENKVLTSKAGSILKTRIDDVNDRLNSINLTWDRIQNKPLVTSITSGNNNNIPSEGAIIRYVNGRVDSVNTTINSKIGEVNTKITALEGRPFTYDALLNKPVMITGASYGTLGSSRAQLQLRQILDSPELKANVMPGSEFLLSHSLQAFDKKGDLIDLDTIKKLDALFDDFRLFVKITQKLRSAQDLLHKEAENFDWENI